MTSGYKMSKFIDEMLDMERIETGRYELKIKQLIPESILEESVKTNRINANKRNVDIVFIDKGERRTTFTDPIKLEQVFNNIITNSIKFAPENSKIKITFKEIKGNKFKVSISDMGPGIHKEELGSIFDRYYQARRGVKTAQRVYGLGLGLYISKKIVLLHGGKIWVKNNPKEGCVFHIEIPYNDRSEPEE
jgi:signal transduction histidine kinase